MFLSSNKKVTGVWNSEVGSRKSMEKAEDIQFHPWNTTYIFTAVKIQLYIFSRLWNIAFWKYALYLINIFLYFITLYIIKTCLNWLLLPVKLNIKVSKSAKIRNWHNQVPHLTQDTNGKVTNSQLYTTNYSQEVSPFPAGEHKTQINRRPQMHGVTSTRQKKHKRSTKEVLPWKGQ